MDQFGEESRIPYLDIEQGDVGVVIAFPLATLVLANLVGLATLALPLAGVAVLLGFGVVLVRPNHMNSMEWLAALWEFEKRPNWTFSVPVFDEVSLESTETKRNEGGLMNYTPFKPDERTQDLTNIERAWPGAGAVQRRDGVYEAFVEIEPGNMDFAMAEDWANVQTQAAEFANKELDFELKFHATTQSFPVEQLVDRIDERQLDEDVKQNPIFAELLDEYRERRPEEMRARGAQELRFFLGVQADDFEVYDRFEDENTPAESLADIPLLGILFAPFVTRRQSLSEAEERMAVFSKLDDRLAAIEDELVQNISGWDSRRLSTVELFVLCAEFWNGEEHEFGDDAAVVTNSPAIGARRRGDVDD